MMEEFTVQNFDLLYEEIISTVTENAADTALNSNEIHRLQSLDSLEDAMQAINKFEECTFSNYIVLEKQKCFGNEAFRPNRKATVHWEGPVIKNVCLNEYSGVPFIIVGRKVLCCHLGKDKAVAQKKRYAESTNRKKATDNASVRRRKSFQHTKKMDCPAKIYIYHMLKFPGFQLKKKSEWRMRSASKKLRDALEKNIELKHCYVILFPPLSHHNNHPVDGKMAYIKQKVDPRVIEKITELSKSGVSENKEIKRLVDHFVSHELFGGQELPVKSRRFFPTMKDIRNIMRRCTNEHKRSVTDQCTVLQLFAQWQQENEDHRLYCRPHNVAEEGETAETFMAAASLS
ncbi:calcium-responsive transcription factor-like isoform X1 [Eleutherodactylus coqui]|uniref:Uncharacterized protein n=1 Tax=Eleutherodactylus coqui TaxID=57060 RepID=A0A8J6EUG6_ELECQ|nr:hypothetical protein GDO78_003669 [Eleutherodactylus coqui]